MEAHILIQQFGTAVATRNKQWLKKTQRVLEDAYLPPKTRYTVVRVIYFPLSRWKTGKEWVRHLKVFETER